MSTDPAASSLPPSQSSQPQTQSDSEPTTTTIKQEQDPETQPQPSDPVPNEADIDAEIRPSDQPPPTTNMSLDGPSDPQPAATEPQPQPQTHPPVPEPRIPHKKDTSLRSFLSKTTDYAPLIPDAVTDHYLTLAGLPPPPQTDRRLARLLALATQKFVADVAADAYQYSRIRSTNTTSNNPLTGLGGAAGFGQGQGGGQGEEGKKGGKEKSQPLGGPRAGYGGGGAGQGGRTVLTMEDLGMAVGEYGVNVKRGEFYR